MSLVPRSYQLTGMSDCWYDPETFILKFELSSRCFARLAATMQRLSCLVEMYALVAELVKLIQLIVAGRDHCPERIHEAAGPYVGARRIERAD